MNGRITAATIDSGTYRHNLQAIRSVLKPTTRLMAILKANAYGHGSVEISKAALL
jgi:alanine racemase